MFWRILILLFYWNSFLFGILFLALVFGEFLIK